MTNKNQTYPEIIESKTKLDYSLNCFDGGESYEADFKEASEHAAKHGGVVYTVCDDGGNKVYYVKGKAFIDRLGYAVIKINNTQNKKSGNKRIGHKQ